MRSSVLAGILDLLTDWAVLAYALWTLIAWVGMAGEVRASALVLLWVPAAILAGPALNVLRRRERRSARADRAGSGEHSSPRRASRLRGAALVGLAAAFVSAVIAAWAPDAAWPLAWAGGVIAVAAAIRAGRLTSGRPETAEPRAARPAHLTAAGVGLALGALSLFINRPDEDDVFYVNRATATAQLNRIPVDDVLFTNEQVAPTSGTGLPLDTFSALEGAVGRVLDVHAASVAYFLVPPLLTFLATWALWRLIRAWAPGNLVPCFLLGCVFWLFSGQGGLTPGSLFVTRMWQGKVVFAAWLVLVVYVYLTRWIERREASTAVLLLAAAVGSVGLTGSAALVMPLLVATAAVPLVARRELRGLPVIAAAGAVPLLTGFVLTRVYPITERLEGEVHGSAWYLHEIFGAGLVAAVGLLALWSAPWLARSGPAAGAVCGIAVVSTFLLMPGVLPALSGLTDLSTTLRRVLWLVPLPALVGLLAAVPLLVRRAAPSPSGLRWALLGPAAAAAALLVAFGQPRWSGPEDESYWVSKPTWKADQHDLADARAILSRYPAGDPILTDQGVMSAISRITVDPKAVTPRRLYAMLLPEAPERVQDRLTLSSFVMGMKPVPPAKLRRALTGLSVGLVCPRASLPEVIASVEATGAYRRSFELPGLACFERAGPA
jgi:hypothetical protein